MLRSSSIASCKNRVSLTPRNVCIHIYTYTMGTLRYLIINKHNCGRSTSSSLACNTYVYIYIYIYIYISWLWLTARRSAKDAPSKQSRPVSSKGTLALASLQQVVRRQWFPCGKQQGETLGCNYKHNCNTFTTFELQ